MSKGIMQGYFDRQHGDLQAGRITYRNEILAG